MRRGTSPTATGSTSSLVLPRDLHPAAWWLWALGLAAAASQTTNPWLLLLVVLVASVTVLARRTDAPWALSFRLYLALAALVVAIRVFFRILLGGGLGEVVLVDLPSIPLPDWTTGITLLGPVTAEAVLGGLYDGMRLGAIIVCVGAANSLANPRRLLAALPPALYEVGTAVVIAFSLFPQLAESVQRVRRARRLRGDPGKGVAALRRIVVPVLEDALERSLSLAASMDARGYGRAGDTPAGQRRLTGALLVGGLLGITVGSYALLDVTLPRPLAWSLLAVGTVMCVLGFRSAGRRVRRTRYRPDRWHTADVVTAASGIVAAVLMGVVAAQRLDVVYPAPIGWPALSVLALLAPVVAFLPALVTPAPAQWSEAEAPDPTALGRDWGAVDDRVA